MSNLILMALTALQSASVGSLELDELFARAMGYQPSFGDGAPAWCAPDGRWCDELPHWTTNLADALFFLGPNALYTLNNSDAETCARAIGHLELSSSDDGPNVPVDVIGEAQTLPLAVCVLVLQLARL